MAPGQSDNKPALMTKLEALQETADGGCNIIFACPKCGATFRAVQKRKSNVPLDSFACLNCDTVVHRWSGVYDYIDWHPFKIRWTAGKSRPQN